MPTNQGNIGLEPNAKDVLLGRGQGRNREANLTYRGDTKALHPLYVDATIPKTVATLRKKKIVSYIVKHVLEEGGRFLRKGVNGWYEIESKERTKVVAQSVRVARPGQGNPEAAAAVLKAFFASCVAPPAPLPPQGQGQPAPALEDSLEAIIMEAFMVEDEFQDPEVQPALEPFGQEDHLEAIMMDELMVVDEPQHAQVQPALVPFAQEDHVEGMDEVMANEPHHPEVEPPNIEVNEQEILEGMEEAINRVVEALRKGDVNEAIDASLSASPRGTYALFTAMQRHEHEVAVQEHGCCAILNLACNKTTKFELASSGAIEAIVTAMWKHQRNASIEGWGCRSLWMMAGEQDSDKIKISNTGGIDVVVGAMWNHPANVEIQEKGCWALRDLAINNYTKDKIVDSDGIAVIYLAMKNHLHNDKIQEQGCGALLKILTGNNANRRKISTADGVNVITHALQNHPSNAKVKEWGGRALSIMQAVISRNAAVAPPAVVSSNVPPDVGSRSFQPLAYSSYPLLYQAPSAFAT